MRREHFSKSVQQLGNLTSIIDAFQERNRGPDVENLDVENLNVDKLGLKGDTFDLEGDKKSWMSKSMDWMSKA